MTQSQIDPQPIAQFLSDVHLAPRQAYKSLTLWPLVRSNEAATDIGPEYQALSVALAKQTVHIDEVSEGGSVPHVRVTNKGTVPVLFLFGEEIRGAKQNRVANASFLVAAGTESVIDVSCVEAGRWSRARGEAFVPSEEVLSSRIRRKMSMGVGASRASGQGFRADQGEVWGDIGALLREARVSSSTSAYSDYRESRTSDLDAMAQAFRCVEGQVGFVACIGDEVAGLEAIGRPEVFEADFSALLRAYAIDAVDAALVKKIEKRPSRSARFASPEQFLAEVETAVCLRGPSLGLGEDVRLEASKIAGCALEHGALIHATVFPA